MKTLITILTLFIIIFLYQILLNAENVIEIIWQAEGEQEDDHFGYATTTLDFNGDGIDDLAVGATMHYLDENYHMHRGSLYFYFGSNDGLPEIPDISIYTLVDTNLIVNNNLWNINNLGDMNGDGCDDLGYTQKTNPEAGIFNSMCKILLGGTEPDTIPDYIYEMTSTQVRVNPLGDINGDGYDDAGITNEISDILSYYIVYGGSFEMVPFVENLETRNGYGFRGLGDVNADGYDDFSYYYEGEPVEQPNGSFLFSHHNRFFFGSSIQDTIPDYSLDLLMPNQWAELAPAGDWDNDGYDDFVISGYELTGPEEGGCRLWRGGEQIDWDSFSHLFYFAWFTPAFGDLNGDGKGDLVKIYQYFGLGGYLYFFLGDQNGTFDYEWFYDYEGLGFNECVGDFNNDGYDDIAAGAKGNDSYPDYGQVFVFGGHSGLVEQDPNIEVDENSIPNSGVVFNAYPNPFNPSTTISFSIPEESKVELTVYNIKGQKVKTLTKDVFVKGFHKLIWNGRDDNYQPVGSGIYFYKFNVNGKYKSVKKCLLLK